MSISFRREPLARALGLAARVSSGRSSIPALSHTHVRIRDGVARVEATNLDVWLTVDAPCEGGEAEWLIPSALAAEAVAKMPSATVVADDVGGRLRFSGGAARLAVPQMERDAWPTRSPVEGGSCEVEASGLSFLLSANYAASSDKLKPTLAAVCLRSADGRLEAVTCDGQRLARRAIAADGVEIEQILLPTTAAGVVAKLLTGVEGAVKLTLGGAWLSVAAEGFTVDVRLGDGSPPKFDAVLANARAALTGHAIVSRSEFLDALARAAIVARTAEALQRVGIVFGAKFLTLAVNEEGGSTEESVDTAEREGPEVRADFNAAFLREALVHCPGDMVRIGVGQTPTGKVAPGYIFSPTDDTVNENVVIALQPK